MAIIPGIILNIHMVISFHICPLWLFFYQFMLCVVDLPAFEVIVTDNTLHEFLNDIQGGRL